MRKVSERKPKRKRMRREYGPSEGLERMKGLADAARKCALEQQLFLNFNSVGKPVN
jgi:hypothetical protein